jgi:hypothetical protein
LQEQILHHFAFLGGLNSNFRNSISKVGTVNIDFSNSSCAALS